MYNVFDGSKLRNIEAIKGLEKLEFANQITFFVGENGSGKSTLLEAIAIAYGFNPEGGTKNYSFYNVATKEEDYADPIYGDIRVCKTRRSIYNSHAFPYPVRNP